MVDITLEIIFNEATHDLSYDLDKQAQREINGDIVAIHDTAQYATKDRDGIITWNDSINSPRTDFIHCTDYPTANTRSDRLTGRIKAASFIVRLRENNFLVNDLPAKNQAELNTDRETTIPWVDVEGILIAIKSVTESRDPSKDNYDTKLTDGDLR